MLIQTISFARSLIGEERHHFVFHDGSAQCEAELVLIQHRSRLIVAFEKVVVSVEGCISKVLPDVAVKLVASGFCHHVDIRAVSNKISRNNPDAQPDTEHVVDIGDVSPSQFGQQIGEGRSALLARRVIGVLNQVIIQIIAAGTVARFHHLQPAEVRVAAELLSK